jgi:hypothetical protein
MFQFNDPESISKLFVRKSSCFNSVLQTVERSGNYCITVFPLRVESGIADSQVSHREEVFIIHSTSPMSTPSSGTEALHMKGDTMN